MDHLISAAVAVSNASSGPAYSITSTPSIRLYPSSPLPPITVQTSSPPNSPAEYMESYFGFCRDKIDAQLLCEAVIAGIIQPIADLPAGCSAPKVRSGSVIVFPENASQTMRVRWRDSKQWSSSKVSGSYLLYRQVVPTSQSLSNTVPERPNPYQATSTRPNTKLVPNGLAKRTISLTGSNGAKFRVISYFVPDHVDSLPVPSEMTEFRELMDRIRTVGSAMRVNALVAAWQVERHLTISIVERCEEYGIMSYWHPSVNEALQT
ncbi:hypothetical protein BCR33DRAFT_761012 [Rhizoclosmatium globosum]|uniref:Uncharacterized protein n=1 Tax=Rhizoclosmatium globosum TaxID=329046 RepID=A0A1Y2D3E5_9FUNG|nr:hypothetical protein BCR33DRAFT_761012 [Rhizoclosmatium globosum]|eukprot:ORY53636.1 hypothetical protein BCR33DRAFT_761012 [Rhizoclosmatium globosum]